MKWTVYILRCADGTLYTGITTNPTKRIRQHNGEITGGAKYTRSRRPCRMVYQELAENRSLASKREYEIKRMTRKEKLKLIRVL
jgi:putative endonuclease